MPTYQYACKNAECGNRFELVQSFTDPAASECPVCHQDVRKVYGSVGVVFKGSGFYRNDSRSASVTSESGSSSGDAKSSDSKSSDSKSADSKSSESKSSGSGSGSAAGNGSTSGNGSSKPASPTASKPAAASA